VAVTTANVTDRQGALAALERCKPSPGQVQSLLCDSACAGEPFAQGVQAIPGEHVTVRIAGRSELHTSDRVGAQGDACAEARLALGIGALPRVMQRHAGTGQGLAVAI